jgi:hypothetical protein
MNMLRRIGRTTTLAIAVCIPLIALSSADAAAQGRRGGRAGFNAGPDYWVGLSYGYQNGITVNDGDTNAQWAFGYTQQIRATLEKSLQPGVSLGVSAGFSNAPLTYTTTDPIAGGACGFQCSATGDITQYMAFIHGGTSPTGFHGIYDLEAGFTEFSNFHTKDGDVKFGPTDAKYDFSFGLGGGVGYTMSRDADIYVTEIFDFVLHPQGNNTSSSAPRLPVFRAGFRVGF